MQDIIKKADILIEALPYIKRFKGKVVVIKYGGSAMGQTERLNEILLDIIFMSYVGLKPILVHGGGPFINKRLKQKNKRIEFVDGFRVTDEETMRIVEDVLTEVNCHIVKRLKDLGGDATGLNSKNGVVIKAAPRKDSSNLGFVGEITSINTASIMEILEISYIPVISPVGIGMDKKPYNINADEAACRIAIVLKAEKLAILTDVRGILRYMDREDSLIPTLHINTVDDLVKRHIIQQGMLPKVNSCVEAIKGGVGKAHIIDARIPHALLLEIFTDKGIGTEIVK